MSRSNRRPQGGFTLIELMIAVLIFSAVIALTFESLTRQQKTSIVTTSIVEAQNNVRAIASLLEREIRMAGFMVPDAVGVCGIDNTTAPDELYVSETEPIVPDDERAGDLGARLGTGQNWNPATTSGTVTLNLDSTTTDLDDDGSFFYDNDNNGTNEADFRAHATSAELRGGFILADMANPGRGSVCGTVQAATSTQITINVLGGQLAVHSATNDAEEEIVIVPAARYYILGGTLRRNGDLLADSVEDLQISYLFDNDDDGIVDAGEEVGISATSLYAASAANNEFLREVRFSIVVATDNDADYADGSFMTFENRADPGLGNDGLRRRALQAAVRPRNIGNTGSI